ncbi:benzoate-CoA ligase family protein [Actinokineospora iranica]|uniref:Benzoate-CoA ligase family n=1 Tax=Actinokineospora iranica TaxID=1271860 RepID=A0A1G6VX48_9PSEU|nr:benzoate-CoA ligase family protein [Actinokineospora iranica]SDD57557.1 benzoate-CoA ligase family [Actinokineospora iranica]
MSQSMNASAYLLDRRIEAGLGERTAVVEAGGRLDYRTLHRRVESAASQWRAAGLRPEERVVLYAADSADLLVALLSVLRCGAIAVPAPAFYTAGELAAVLHDCRARVLVVGDTQGEQTRQALAQDLPDLRAVVFTGEPEFRPPDRLTWFLWREFLRQAESPSGPDDAAPDRTTEDSPALWLYTSGTTGTPKAAMHRHGSIRFVAESYGRQVLGLGETDRCFSVAKLSFAYGLGNSCFLPLAAGAAAVLEPARPTAAVVARRLVADRPTVFFGVPTSYAALLREPDIAADVFASVRLAVSAGETLPAELHRRVRDRFGVDLVDGLGSTETLHIFLSNRPGRTRPGSTGAAVPGYRLRVVAEDGSPAPVGRPGTLHVRAPSAATGYWGRVAEGWRVFHGAWVNTGDLVTRGADDHYTYLGRTTEVIKSGGLWVSPAEVEAHLLRHPGVGQAAVVAAPDADGLDKPVACVVAAADASLDPDDLREFCHAGLPAFKRPCRVLVVDALPTTGNGKLRREAVRAMVIDLLAAAAASNTDDAASGEEP